MRKNTSPIHKSMGAAQSSRLQQQFSGFNNDQYITADPIINCRMRGSKIHMAQVRQKQKLKGQLASNSNSVKAYLQYISEDKHLAELNHQQLANTRPANFSQKQRSKTAGVLTAEARSRNAKRSQQNDEISPSNRNMMVTSTLVRPRNPGYRVNTYFVSNNLDHKTNDYMNMLINNEGKQSGPLELSGWLQAPTMVPNQKKLTNFQRRMRSNRRKPRNQNREASILNRISRTVECKYSGVDTSVFGNKYLLNTCMNSSYGQKQLLRKQDSY